MITLAQEPTIADILHSDVPLLDTVSDFLDNYLGVSVRTPQTATNKNVGYPILEEIISSFTADQVRAELREIYKRMRRKEYEKS